MLLLRLQEFPYLYGPFRNRLISRRGGINGSNIFPLDNNVYDANIMNNFEYLQTGIPNDEYQVGYVNDDPPKLDTTYAAASLAGISLFGTILYKYGPFRNRLNSGRGAMNGSNIFPLDNSVYDANLMNNFEYLQTGIPNDEYQLGYGSITDY
ncbi:PIR protein [Plasmodium vivax]|uniref:VIR protein n=1 Tax=Plasmodium vivax TaxID=5855 RepID=A0A564ZXV8_PLAVI|nr:PIR protein [Plasmodium vivax]